MKRIIAITLCLLSLALLVSCGGTKANNEAEAYLIKNFDALKAGTKEAMFSLMDEDEAAEAEAVFEMFDFTLMFKKFDYKINSSTIDGDTATADVTVSNIDFGVFMEDVMAKAMEFAMTNPDAADMTEEEAAEWAMELMEDLLKNGDYDTVSTDITLNLVKKDGEWTIENGDELASALFAGLM